MAPLLQGWSIVSGELSMTRLNAVFSLEFDQSAGTVETPTAFLMRGKTPPHKCPGDDIKSSDGKTPTFEIWIM